MKVIYKLGKIKNQKQKFVVAIGIFDGVHRGHQTLIKRIVKKARRLKIKSAVLTFDPHPIHVLYPEKKLPLIVPLKYRLNLIEHLGVDIAFVIKFTKSFSQLSPRQFIHQYLVKFIHLREVIVGDDFRFGQNRSGSVEDFVAEGGKLGFKVTHIHPLQGDSVKISSSRIRELIRLGKLKEARLCLGRDFSIVGKVVQGDSRGKELGFPTANIAVENEIILPWGVYVVRVLYKNESLEGVANIGVRPTFNKDKKIQIEVHIFNFKQTLYGQEIVVEFLKKIRNEKKFPDAKALVLQIRKDVLTAKKFFRK